jgi:hypothetical protein
MEMDPSKETLTAFLDGELPPNEMERIAALLTTRPDLDAWVRKQERLCRDLKGAFSDVMTPPPSPALLAAVQNAPASRRWILGQKLAPWMPGNWIGVGAALAVGLAIGIVLQPAGNFVSSGGQTLAQGRLADALDHQLASAGYDGSGARIGISFRDRSGHECRTFDEGRQSGLACHQAAGWHIAILMDRPIEPAGAYQMEGSELPEAVRQAVMTRIQGLPFDAAAERAARDRGWK